MQKHASGSGAVEVVRRYKQGLTAGIALILIAGAGYGVYLLFGAKPVPFQNYSITQITDNAKSQAAVISSDGKYILSVIDDAGKASLWLRHVPTNTDTQVIAPAETFYPDLEFSADGNYLYFRKARGRPLTNFKTDRIRSFRWSPDGKNIGVLCERVEGDVVLLRESSAKN